jgi:serine/threonine protein kinase/Flp pilus assembly protein TadD
MTEANNNQDKIIKDAVRQFADARLRGEQLEIDEFVKKYPQLENQIREGIKNLQKIDALFDTLAQPDDSDFKDTASGPDLVGQKVGSFEIKEMIGHGGMGVVYLAHDTKLDRSVAIKSIPPKLADDSTARTRFRREAKLLASLNHPNIGAIHDIIEQDAGADYLILEYVPGQTLAQRIARKPLKLEEAFSIAQQIAEAVSAAHEKGVVHRDLKPGNIKITTEGKVKVLDFGLAKPSVKQDENQSTAITQPGRVIGTPAYMSPEQARGKPVDRRSDIWSFACILYEMLTGHSPFESDTATDTLARIIERQPDWQALPQQTPANIRVILRHCLEKDPRWRLQNIKDAAIEIREALNLLSARPAAPVRTGWPKQRLGGTGPGRIKSLAVLPLENLTGDPNQEYFADGLTEALIANLGKIGALQVRSRTSIMQYKAVKKLLPEIARELSVDAVVEGSVIRIAERVRITAQLIHARTDSHLWADSYERDPRDILTLLSEVARTIARRIEITLTPDQEAQLAVKRPINPEMYNLYLKGMFHLNKETPKGTKIGLDYLQQAIAQDPEDPLAYGGLALGYVISTHGPGAPPDAFERAKAAALKALELDDNLAEAHAALAMAKVYRDWDWEGAAKAYRRALQLNPNLTLTRAHYAFYLLLFERIDDALAEMRKVQEMDPLTPLWPAWQGWLYLHAEQYDEAIKETNKSLELYSDFPISLYIQGCAYAEKGVYERAIKLHQKAGELSHEWKCGLARTYAMAGRLDETRQALAELEANHTPWDTWFIASIYVALGEKDQAFRWLKAAYGPPNHPYLPWMRCVPEFKPLRDDPRFSDLLSRMNLPE